MSEKRILQLMLCGGLVILMFILYAIWDVMSIYNVSLLAALEIIWTDTSHNPAFFLGLLASITAVFFSMYHLIKRK